MKEKFSFFIEMFTKLVTIIFICSAIYICVFDGFDAVVHIKYIWGVLALAFILSLARLPLYTDKILSRKVQIFANVLYLIFADAVLLGIGFLLNWFSLEFPATIVGIEIVFVVVTVVIWISLCLSNKRSEEKLNEQLKKIKKE